MPRLAASIEIGPFAFTDCSYDAGADIAYLSIGAPKEALSWESPEGHLVRLDPESNEVVGITLLNLRKRIESSGKITVTLPEHVFAHEPLIVPRAEISACCT